MISKLNKMAKFLSAIDITTLEDLELELNGQISKPEEDLLIEYGTRLNLHRSFIDLALSTGKKGREAFRKGYLSFYGENSRRDISKNEQKRDMNLEIMGSLVEKVMGDGIRETEEKALIERIGYLEGYDRTQVKELFRQYGYVPDIAFVFSPYDEETGLIKEILSDEYDLFSGSLDKENKLHLPKLRQLVIVDPNVYFDPMISRTRGTITEDERELKAYDDSKSIGEVFCNIKEPVIVYARHGELDPSAWGLDLEKDRILRRKTLSQVKFNPEEINTNPYPLMCLRRGIDNLLYHINEIGRNGK